MQRRLLSYGKADAFLREPLRRPPEMTAMETRRKEAAERAEVYAPKPTGGAWLAGACGAVVAMVVLFTIGKIYELPLQPNLIFAAPIVLTAFVSVYIGYRRARDKNRKAQADEVEKGR